MNMKTNELPKPPRQKTSVVIEGLDTSTPDDLVKDGKCETLHNLRYKEGAWRPVHPHTEKFKTSFISNRTRIVYHHPAAGEDCYIVEQAKAATGPFNYGLYNTTTGAVTLFAGPYVTHQRVSHFGNILMLSDDTAIHRYLLKNGVYSEYTQPSEPTMLITNTNYPYRSLPDFFRVSEDIYSLLVDASDENNGVSYTRNQIHKKDKWIKGSKLYEVLQDIKRYNSTIDFWTQRGETVPYSKITPTISSVWLLSDADERNPLIPSTPKGHTSEGATAWHGEIALFAAYRTEDGSVISPSPLHIELSDNTLNGHQVIQEAFFSKYDAEDAPSNDPSRKYIGCVYGVTYSDTLTISDIMNHCPYSYILPNITVGIASKINTDIIKGVAIYSTRLNPIFDAGLYVSSGNDIPTNKVWAQNKLPEQPFYLLTEFPIEPNEDGTYKTQYQLSLDSLMLEQLTANKVYTPIISHDLASNVAIDYNNSLHIGGVTTFFSKGGILSYPYLIDKANSGSDTTVYLSISSGNIATILKGATRNTLGQFQAPFNRILSYHDYRADRVISEWGESESQSLFTLKPAIGNNIAYYISPSNDTRKYPDLWVSGGVMPTTPIELPETSQSLYQPNKLQVSAPNNSLVFPFENSYSFGSASNRILAMQSAAIEMHEMKVGELPLYVFTEEGIFALVAGSNTLYSSVAAINYDKIINPNTLAINGAIVYITEKGVHLLTSAGTQVISQPIHDAQGMPPIDFLRRCKIVWPKQYNEIVLLDEESTTGKAYVFNLDAGYWSTRTLQGVKLNTDELYNNNTIYNLADENEVGALPISLATRPIKLGNVEFKRAETIIPRMSTGDNLAIVDFNLTGSVDGTNYLPLRSWNGEIDSRKVNPLVFRRTPFSAKYFKVAMNIEAETGESLTTSISHIDFEWYARFLHRMR